MDSPDKVYGASETHCWTLRPRTHVVPRHRIRLDFWRDWSGRVLLAEMQHRIVKARAVTSEETRQHLQDAHRRVMSVAAVQQHLHASGRADTVEIAPYLSKLCDSLAESMIGESRPAALTVTADRGACCRPRRSAWALS